MSKAKFLLRPPHRTTISAIACSFCVALLAFGPGVSAQTTASPTIGPAVDWQVLARLRQTLQADVNRTLSEGDADLEGRGIANVELEVKGRTKRTEFSVTTGLSGGLSTGSESDNLNRIDPNLLASAIYSGKLVTLNSSASFRARPTSVSEIDDSGATDVDATRFDVGASIGASWQATPRDQLSVTTTADIVDFSRSVGTLSASQTFGVSVGWSRQATRTTLYSFSAGFRHFDSDGVSGRNSEIFNIQAGLQHQRTSRHTFGFQSGVSIVSNNLNTGASNTSVGFSGGASFDYKLEDFRAGLDVNQSVQPSSAGDLNTVTTLMGDIAYRVNALQSLGFSISYRRRSDVSGGDVLQVLSVGPNYRYSLGKDTNLSLAYQFRLRDDAANSFVPGHRVLLTLAHDLTLLP